MKYIFKIRFIFVIFMSMLFVMPDEYMLVSVGETMTYGSLLDASKPQETDIAKISTTGVKGIVKKILGFVRVASALMSILVIAFAGFQYIVAADAEMKNEMKKKMLPLIIGLILVFSASTITYFLLGVVGA